MTATAAPHVPPAPARTLPGMVFRPDPAADRTEKLIIFEQQV